MHDDTVLRMCSSNLFDFHLFSDDSNLFYDNKDLSTLEATGNKELQFTTGCVLTNSLLMYTNLIMSFFSHLKSI